MDNDFCFDRCNEVQKAPDGHLDLWFRGGWKSSIITFGLSLQDILNDQEVTIGIFSHTRPQAKTFLRQIMSEMEGNEKLRTLFPDILWDDPAKQSPKWNEDEGIIVHRLGNPPEATVEAWGLIDGMPTGKHFGVLNYDDIITEKHVTNPDMIQKSYEAMRLSFNLCKRVHRKRWIGTRYHYNDPYGQMINDTIAIPRIYPATKDGSISGESWFLSTEELALKRKEMGPYIFASQMLQNPLADEAQNFKEEWLRYYDSEDGKGMTKILLVDSASAKKRDSDYTAMWVIGLGSDENLYALDIVWDRMNLTQRAATLMELHRKWKPIEVRYEKYGIMADIEHIRTVQEREHYRFEIREVGGSTSKDDRIKRLLPYFEQSRIYLPATLWRTLYDGKTTDIVKVFVQQEYKAFPVSAHKDLLDSLARIAEPDLPLPFPEEKPRKLRTVASGGKLLDWMAS